VKKLPRNVWAVTLTSFLTDVSSEMIVYLVPLFLANVLGARTNIIGLIEGLAETTASLLKLFSGWLSDKLRSRKWITVAGYGLSATANFPNSRWPALTTVSSISCSSCLSLPSATRPTPFWFCGRRSVACRSRRSWR
jgi:MFS family permease